ncbi:MAG: bifunctional alpha,alpha-trehalose-phosphate synthase (UDP-forming)/trehalose-phosphatase [Syntrophobacterales bacterium]|nr:bifunctional alpha,alpha-trehalose-phosphate synthase (UDP-forming)/trehalose-phosphatase [Syntrophobacterales bacterium]
MIIVSNRLPITVVKKINQFNFQPSVGGLATGLGSILDSQRIWIGWPGISSGKIDAQEKEFIKTRLAKDSLYPIFLNQNNFDLFYNGFCNKTIWPLFHHLIQYAVFEKRFWQSYEKVNSLFLDMVLERADPEDIIWVHDYHLMLLPALIREKLPNASIGFFLHIPFPSFEIFRLLPWKKEIISGLLGADLVGFHTFSYVKHFLDSVRRTVGFENSYGEITVGTRPVKVDSFPMGIDFDKFSKAANHAKVKREISKIRKNIKEQKILLSIDRLDYTKGMPQRLEAFNSFLDKYPEFEGKVTYILVAVPSRTKVEDYRLLKKQVDELVGKINGAHGTFGWMPVWYIYSSLQFHTLAALYALADVALVTPFRDGMNLIAKEFIASKNDLNGTLILSETAGVAEELGEAVIVNPNDRDEIVEAIKDALSTPDKMQTTRNRAMRTRLQRYNVEKWAQEFTDTLTDVKKRQADLDTTRLTYRSKIEMLAGHAASSKSLILLDYDGTLVPIADMPEKAEPDEELLQILTSLKTRNTVVILSGRNKQTLEDWLAPLELAMAAEHGAWIKEKKKEWKTVEPTITEWKKSIMPIIEMYVDRTPGSFIEEKDFSLVWHYRKCNSELAEVRAKELKDILLSLTANLNVGFIEGKKVIEVKDTNINKGKAAMKWISERNWDFILAIGDDCTDEDLFRVLPDTAYSLKVGSGASRARFNLSSFRDVRKLLEDLI